MYTILERDSVRNVSVVFLYSTFYFGYFYFFFFFNDTATTEIYTLSLHDALPISANGARVCLNGLGLQALELKVLQMCLVIELEV